MSIRINWPQIVSQLGASYDAPTVFILPSAGRQLLLSVTNRMTWEATFRTDNYDFSDWDNLQALIAQTEYGLMTGIPMDELITALENGFSLVATAIDNQVFPDCPDITLQACNSLANGDFPDEPPVDIDEYPTPHATTPEPTAPTYDEYKCSAANKYIDSVRNLIDNLMELTLQASPYTWLYELLTNEEFGHPVYQTLIAIYNFLTNNTYGRIKDDILAAYDRNSDAFLCAIYTSDTPADAMTIIDDVIANDEAGFIIRFLLRMFVIDSTTLDPIWVEDEVDITGYETATCDCTTPPDYEVQLGTLQPLWDGKWGTGVRGTIGNYAFTSSPVFGAGGGGELESFINDPIVGQVDSVRLQVVATNLHTSIKKWYVRLHDVSLAMYEEFTINQNELPLVVGHDRDVDSNQDEWAWLEFETTDKVTECRRLTVVGVHNDDATQAYLAICGLEVRYV